ncbi:putative hydro-lyase [Vibrio sp. Isolate31]|uniref:putative hydro-lyase n=1 Tax=unclassified Vibrio TaxID=2614977 RepID=UPI001EFE2BE8|nr:MULTISPECIES: putative hydro-lyase [unclassified Vibrio]MCG9555153.1 putative hydro-lyase [Vibrio sp. Isolate32]MCG9601609.1 putative hydro-lyase [Vibrio sp. Isolate31]
MPNTHSKPSAYKTQLLAQASEVRKKIRFGKFNQPTSGVASGLVQGNIVILPQEWANDFLRFCQNNSAACPLIAVSQPGHPLLSDLGEDIDIRTDVPEFKVFRHGEHAETVTDINSLWQSDFVTFVLGCSFSFEDALERAGLTVRNIESQTNVSMYKTNIQTTPSGRFHGNMVVSMRPFVASDAIRAIQVTSRLPKAHGAPVHIGDPALIGIDDLSQPDFGDAVDVHQHELPIFWACGVTPQVAIANAKPPIAITHVPGKMLITDCLNDELAVL